ncbi:filamentous hemagglutinin N-terminal domain-containing protein [Nostoc sp. FACHB-152]|uniref:two-partner secretion domain-containing protein n=1 Tax=unclassified Nostoc TaxID=2593658 RepID=UPI00168909D7|nr:MULTISPECIES: filamentous hemagglutinin N-terminal domain-containing protein [unclassified Nostoc]MBD2451939.1 filamentous hemagglutinin N-terminal domain-containing protein [Nostoc sp. FACHB-152]MBD2472568.1 filamentous hemagglutinin N-terminal domain-containing protein [Nostoc sp. FACHB-145]
MIHNWKSYCWRLGLAIYLAIGGIIICSLESRVFAQSIITPDNTLGNESSGLEPYDDVNDFITGGAVRGSNVFHSFREFNVGEGRGAFFLTNTNNIQNIIARVTGSNISKILGTLGAFQLNNGGLEFSNANLFLINPNGIIIGPNAYITVGGSFFGSTASGIKFADGTTFSATDKQTGPLLTVSTPIGLQFGSNSGSILLQNSLIAVSPEKTLALVGGNVTIDGGLVFPPPNDDVKLSLQAEGGQIAIGGISEPGTVGLNLESNNQPLTFPNGVALADISFINGAVINANGNGGGNIQLQGKNINLTGGSLLSADTIGDEDGRGISITAEQLTVKDGSQIRASTRSSGAGGNLTVNVSDTVQVSGTDAAGNPSALFAETFAQGDAGNLSITTKKLIVEDGGNIAAAARVGSQGNGGTLIIKSSDFVRLSGTSLVNRTLPSGLFAETQGSGNGGALTINTRQLLVNNGAQVTAGTLAGSSGNGGTLTVNATDSIELSSTGVNGQPPSGLFARSRGSGDAGSLNIFTSKLTVRDNARVTVENLGSGDAGNLTIQARDVRLDKNAIITAETTSGRGGNISLEDLDFLLLQDNSQITTNADTSKVGADVAGGNIDIDSKVIVATLRENSDITATAFKGRGGNINITTDGLFGIAPFSGLNPRNNITNDITAASELGINGTIQINTPDESNRGIVELPAEVVDASNAIAQGCSGNIAKTRSEIIVTGRGGLPPSPNEPLTSDIVWSDTRLNAIARLAHNSKTTTTKLKISPDIVKIAPASGWVFNQQGEVTLIANAANVTPYIASNHSSCLKNHTGI